MQLKTLLKHLDLTTLQLLLSIHEHGTLTQASHREAIAVSAASKRLHELEDVLGEPLFVRERTGMTLTHAGEIVALHAREMIGSAQRMNSDLNERRSRAHKTVRVAANLSAIIQIFPDDLNRFMAVHPGIQIKLNEMPCGAVLQSVRDGNADLGICANPDLADDCVDIHPYRRDRLVLIAPSGSPLAQRTHIPFADTLDIDYIGFQNDSWVNRRSQRAANAVGRRFSVKVQVTGFDALCRLVHAGMGIGLVPYQVFRAIGQPLNLICVTLDDAWTEIESQIIVPRNQPLSVETSMLLEHMRLAAQHEQSGGGEAALRLRPPAAQMPIGNHAMFGETA